MSDQTVFEAVGGQAFFDRLVDAFYERVEHDEVLRPLYPDDLEPGKHALALFLGQYWGGPPAYSAVKGHPRLRMRHAPFVIGPAERDAWLTAMFAALTDAAPPPEIETAMRDYFEMAATHMINSVPPGATMGS
ncbi:MAG TPA: globin [Acidimicrobiia bacterium]|nr:globin [Acidimicrobiia bacterium]